MTAQQKKKNESLPNGKEKLQEIKERPKVEIYFEFLRRTPKKNPNLKAQNHNGVCGFCFK